MLPARPHILTGSYHIGCWERTLPASQETLCTDGAATSSLLRDLRAFVVEKSGGNQRHLACPAKPHWIGHNEPQVRDSPPRRHEGHEGHEEGTNGPRRRWKPTAANSERHKNQMIFAAKKLALRAPSGIS